MAVSGSIPASLPVRAMVIGVSGASSVTGVGKSMAGKAAQAVQCICGPAGAFAGCWSSQWPIGAVAAGRAVAVALAIDRGMNANAMRTSSVKRRVIASKYSLCPSSFKVEPVEPQGIGNDAYRTQSHRGTRDDGRQQKAEGWVEDSGGNRHACSIISEGE